MTRARTHTLVVSAVALLLLAGCSPSSSPAPAPTAPATAQPTEAAPEPSPTPTASWKAQPIRDGLVTVAGTSLLAPADSVTEGTASGWYAALEVEAGTNLDEVSASFAEQLSAQGLTVATSTLENQTRTITAEGIVKDRAVRFDVQIAPGVDAASGAMTILSASEPVAAS